MEGPKWICNQVLPRSMSKGWLSMEAVSVAPPDRLRRSRVPSSAIQAPLANRFITRLPWHWMHKETRNLRAVSAQCPQVVIIPCFFSEFSTPLARADSGSELALSVALDSKDCARLLGTDEVCYLVGS